MKGLLKLSILLLTLSSASIQANEAYEMFSKLSSSLLPVGEGVFGDNPKEIAIEAQDKFGIDGILNGKDPIDQISIIEGFVRTDYIFLGNIRSENPQHNIQSYEEILAQFEKRKELEIVKRVRRFKGNFNHLATSMIYDKAGFSMNNQNNIRPFKKFNQHSFIATSLYSCDAELTEYLMTKGADGVSKGLPDTFAFFKVYDSNEKYRREGEVIFNHHAVITPFHNFMSCLSLNGYYKGEEWINYPEDNPIQPYMENFVKKMITHYLNKPELNLNEFGCYPVIKDYAYENFEWVRKMFTDKYGSDFAERCEKNFRAYEDSCKLIDLPNGGREFKCPLRKY